MPASLSQISLRGTAPSCCSNSHDPRSRSSVFRVGIIRAVTNREWAATITNTGSNALVPSSNGIFFGGNQRSHCTASPAAQWTRSAGSTGACSGRNLATLSRNHRIDPSQPTRSANTVAGIDGVSVNSLRTSASKGVNDVGRGDRSYRGGPTEFTALITVVREIPNLAAIRAFGSPSAASLRIKAQSSKVNTLQSVSVHFSTAATDQFSSTADNASHSQLCITIRAVIRSVDLAHRRSRSWASVNSVPPFPILE